MVNAKSPIVDVYFSMQSDYCYFLIDRLLSLEKRGVTVNIRPVLGGVLRLPERYKDRGDLEADYFCADSKRTAAYLGLPHTFPDPSPIEFEPGSLWIAKSDQPRNEMLNRLFVGAVLAGHGMAFLDNVIRRLWDGSSPAWDAGETLSGLIEGAGMDCDTVLTAMSWDRAKPILDANARAMSAAGHWGVPLMVFEGEPF